MEELVIYLPLECDTWLGYGHSVHGNQEMVPLADNTKLNSFGLLNANDLNGNVMKLELNFDKQSTSISCFLYIKRNWKLSRHILQKRY